MGFKIGFFFQPLNRTQPKGGLKILLTLYFLTLSLASLLKFMIVSSPAGLP